MSRARTVIAFLDRYVLLAGRSCCAGRSWVGLDRSLARRAGDAQDRSGEPLRPVASGAPALPGSSAPADPAPGDAMLAPGCPARR